MRTLIKWSIIGLAIFIFYQFFGYWSFVLIFAHFIDSKFEEIKLAHDREIYDMKERMNQLEENKLSEDD